MGNTAINRNMRCIEIQMYSSIVILRVAINRNMRCIEIKVIKWKIEWEHD